MHESPHLLAFLREPHRRKSKMADGWFLRRALLGSSLFTHADPLRSRCGTVFDGWESLVAIRQRSREEFANNRSALLFIDIDMSCVKQTARHPCYTIHIHFEYHVSYPPSFLYMCMHIVQSSVHTAEFRQESAAEWRPSLIRIDKVTCTVWW